MVVDIFDSRFYLAANQDLVAAGITTDAQASQHYQQFGINENRLISPLYDRGFYRSSFADLRDMTNAELDQHAGTFGVREGRQLSSSFSIDVYLQENPDLDTTFGGDREQAFQHLQAFVLGEPNEVRRIGPDFDANFYDNNPDLQAAGLDTVRELLTHYRVFGINEQRIGTDVQIGDEGVGSDSRDVFRVVARNSTSPIVNISNFQVGTDTLEIVVPDDQQLTFFDLVSRFLPLINDQSGNATISAPTPDGSTGELANPFVSLQGVTSVDLANSPESFAIRSPGLGDNVVNDTNELVFDALRIGGFPPAASARQFALVSVAVHDAVQGVLADPERRAYLQSQGLSLPTLADSVARDETTAEVAAVAAATRVLTTVFTDPNSFVNFSFSGTTPIGNTFNPLIGTTNGQRIVDYFPRVLAASQAAALSEISASSATQAAGIAFGQAIADALTNLRANDGGFRNADGSQVDPNALALEYLDGIEPPDSLNEVGGQDQGGLPPTNSVPVAPIANDGTVGRLQDGSNLIGTGAPISTFDSNGNPVTPNTVTDGVSPTTPGAWRRSEDTLLANGRFTGLASIEVSNYNDAWVIPTTNYFNDSVLPPPALDSQRYIADVEEVARYGSITDLPGAGTVVLNNGFNPTTNPIAGLTNATNTVNGVTSFTPGGVVGTSINDTDPSDSNNFQVSVGNDFGYTQPDGIGPTSADRTIIAHVWANTEGAYGPNYSWQPITQQLNANNNTSLLDSAYAFAALNISLADALTNIWDIKWDEDYFWRPVTSVRNADQIAGTAFIDDNAWTPREISPQHPCHPSGTSLTAGVASGVLISIFGDDQTFTASADVHPLSARLQTALTSINGNDRIDGVRLDRVAVTYDSISAAADDERTSRIFAGGHFRFATENGVNMGEQVARYIIRHNPFLASGPTIV